MAKVYDNANDLITFARSSGGTSLRRVGYGPELVDTANTASAWTPYGTNLIVQDGNTVKISYVDDNKGGFVYLDAAGGLSADMAVGTLYQITFRAKVNTGSATVQVFNGVSSTLTTITSTSYTTIVVNLVYPSGSRPYINVASTLTSGESIWFDNISVKEVFLDRATDPLVEFNHPYDMPRIDFDTNGVAKGLLIEEQRTNLLHSTDNPPSQATDVSAGSHTLSFTAGPSTSSIDQTLNVTAVDVFVYDTKNDTDGGAWRTGSRAQASSWYNETLNTDTRGSRREFPEVAVIVAEAAKVTIYDGDDPSLPMWMVFNASGGLASDAGFLPGSNVVAANILNGVLAVCVEDLSGRGGLYVADFNSEAMKHYNGGGTYSIRSGDISERNDSGGWQAITNSNFAIADNDINDVAMTVLPDAPVDPATGLPVPTIAVATNTGTSIIRDDGSVVSGGEANSSWAVRWIEFAPDNVLWGNSGSLYGASLQILSSPPYATVVSIGTGTNGYQQIGQVSLVYGQNTTWPFALGASSSFIPLSDERFASAATTGLTTIFDVASDRSGSMVAYTTSDYATGWMNGNIKGAFLSDTDNTNLVGGTLLDEDFASGVGGFTAVDGYALVSNVSGRLRVASNDAAQYGKAARSFSTVVGQTYVLNIECFTGTGSPVVYVGSSGGSPNLALVSGAGTKTITFTAMTTTTYLTVYNNASPSADYAEYDNISVKLADADRSVNNKGLIVNGTITRSPVATGADLVGYSGFSISNYLEQPYNSDLDFGQNDFCVMGWFSGGSGNRSIISRQDEGSSTVYGDGNYWRVFSINNRVNFLAAGGVSLQGETVSNNVWGFITLVRRSQVWEIWQNGALISSVANGQSVTNTEALLRIGVVKYNQNLVDVGRPMALWRISATAPTADQIAKIYNDEKLLFQPNAKATLDGTSDAVTALAHDPETDLLHVGTNQSRSVFYGLRRINQTGTAVTTAISAVDGLISEQ